MFDNGRTTDVKYRVPSSLDLDTASQQLSYMLCGNNEARPCIAVPAAIGVTTVMSCDGVVGF